MGIRASQKEGSRICASGELKQTHPWAKTDKAGSVTIRNRADEVVK